MVRGGQEAPNGFQSSVLREDGGVFVFPDLSSGEGGSPLQLGKFGSEGWRCGEQSEPRARGRGLRPGLRAAYLAGDV